MVTEFQREVYAKLSRVPKGEVTTYADLADSLCTSSRAVGQALRRNPYAPRVPCHRVVRSDGSIGGFKGKMRGLAIVEKIRLLKGEGIKVGADDRILKFKQVRHKWNS